jgi:prevent-host-death family protein
VRRLGLALRNLAFGTTRRGAAGSNYVVQTSRTPIPAGQFKAKCLALLDEVAENGQPLVITKRGKPLVRVLPFEKPRSLIGSVTFLVSDEELVKPLWKDWEPSLPRNA